MFGFYSHGCESMACEHIAAWSRQALDQIDRTLQRRPSAALEGLRERFTALERQATSLLNPWQWGTQGSQALSQLMADAYDAFRALTNLVTDEPPAEPGEPEVEAPEVPREAPEAVRPVPIGEHQLPPLPYPYDALEPHIDAETMHLHHDKHHRSYVDGLNKAERMMAQARSTGEFDLIKHWEREAAFNGAGHYLHTIFWEIMSPEGGGEPGGALAEQLQADFGDFARFRTHFARAAERVEGGGWAILGWSPRANRTEILQAEKHQNLSQWDVIPLLPLDVWEHSYYLKYKNDRKAYINAWWNVVNWPAVARRYEKARRLVWEPF